jgi:hypothetical protein
MLQFIFFQAIFGTKKEFRWLNYGNI